VVDGGGEDWWQGGGGGDGAGDGALGSTSDLGFELSKVGSRDMHAFFSFTLFVFEDVGSRRPCVWLRAACVWSVWMSRWRPKMDLPIERHFSGTRFEYDWVGDE
jgi:hypothetical protein